MNLFCRLFGHTWWPETRAPHTRWNTTDDGLTLVPSFGEEEVTHVETCKRCGEERPAPKRRFDADRPAPPAPPAKGKAKAKS